MLGAQLVAGSATLSQATNGTITIAYNSLGDQVAALQFDLGFDSSNLNLTVVTGPAVRSSGKSLYFVPLGAGSSRVLVAGLNQNLIADGGILTLFVSVAPGAGAGPSTLQVTNALGADASGNPVPIPDTSGIVNISSQSGAGSAIDSSGVLSAASLLAGPVSPGEVVTLIGAGIGPAQPASLQLLPSGLVSTNLSNTVVTFDSVQAPSALREPKPDKRRSPL